MSDVSLIRISGPDQTGITQAATAILSDYAVNILDIGQAVIHNNLALGILAEMPDSVDIAAAMSTESGISANIPSAKLL